MKLQHQYESIRYKILSILESKNLSIELEKQVKNDG